MKPSNHCWGERPRGSRLTTPLGHPAPMSMMSLAYQLGVLVWVYSRKDEFGGSTTSGRFHRQSDQHGEDARDERSP